uniref:Protein kinase domain-containing protein n=1 Tax=Bursaphelenchus xylophilus TaxID=6326 RepID=A0A1I7SID4_BURXY
AENLLLDSNHDIKLADFGFSNFYEKENTLDTFCGSPPYAAPEIFEGKLYTGPEIDVWSLGVVLYVLVSGVLPFEGINLQALRDRVLSGRIRIPFFMSTECEQLIRRMLTINPTKRPTIDQIKRHKWMKFEEFEPRYNVAKYLTIDSKEPHPQVMKIIQNMGLNMETVENSLRTEAYDNYHGVYLLLLERLRESSLKLHQLQMYEQQKQSQKRIQEVQNRRRQSDAPPQPRPLLKGLREHSTFQTTDCSDVAPEAVESAEEAKQTKVVEKPLAATTQATVKPINVSTTTITTTLTTVQPSTTSSGHGTSDENDRCSTLSRQSTIGTIGSIDEGVESDTNGSSQSRATFSSRELDNEGSGNSLLTFDPNSVENPDLMSSLSLNSCPSNAEASQNLRPANLPPCCVKALAEERQLQQNPATATNSTETSPCASPQRRCFGEGWRASDNAMFDSLTQPFPTGELGQKSKGVQDVSRPTASHLADKMRKMRLTGPANVAGIAVGGGAKMAAAVHHHHVHPHRHVMLGGVPKRISLPENLEFQPQMLLNLKQAIHVEKQLGAEKSDTNKVLKVRMAQQQQKRLTKARMQMFRQQVRRWIFDGKFLGFRKPQIAQCSVNLCFAQCMSPD